MKCFQPALKLFFATAFLLIFFKQTVFAQYDSIKIDSGQKFAFLNIGSEAFIRWIEDDEFSCYEKTAALSSVIFQRFQDDFDFIILVSNQENVPEGFPYYGRYMMVSNATEGIGTGIFSNSGYFGSSGKLKGIMHIPYKHGILYGPFLHELMHCWANYALPSEVDGHWGFMGGNVPAQLGGFLQTSLEKNVNGNPNFFRVNNFGPFANGGNSVPYSELELYFMGMIPLSDVKVFDMIMGIKNVQQDSQDPSKLLIEADSCVVYDSNRLLGLLGPRNPASSQAQKKFKALFVILTPNPLSNDESVFFNNAIEESCRAGSDNREGLYNFWEATRTMATLRADSLLTSLKADINQYSAVEQVSNLAVYPNPAVDELCISSGYNIDRIIVLNSSGQQMFTEQVFAPEYKLNTQRFRSGVYFLLVIHDDQTETRKIVIERKH